MLPALAVPVGLLLLLRLVPLAAARPEALQPAPALLALGLLSVLAAALRLATDRMRDPAAAILMLHAGLASVAFGLGRVAEALVLASTAAILLPAWRRAEPHPRLRALLLAALALMPPTAGFGAALAILAETVRTQPWLALPLALGLAVALGALARRLPALWHAAPAAPRRADTLAVALLLALATAAGALR
jgi:hydrogenase-4 component F